MQPHSQLPPLAYPPPLAFCFNLPSAWINAPSRANAILSEHHGSQDEEKACTEEGGIDGASPTRRRSVWIKPGSRIAKEEGRKAGGGDGLRPAAPVPASRSHSERRDLITSILTSHNPVSTLSRAGDELHVGDLNIVLHEFGIQRKWESVCKVFEWMRGKNKVNDPSFTSFISLMGKAGYPNRALRVYSSLQGTESRRNPFICNSLLKTLIDAGSVEKAFNLFEQQKREGLVPDIITYSTMLVACSKHQNGYAKALSFFQELLERGLKPDSFIYASMLNVCANFGLEDEAVTTFENLKADGITANIFHYSCLLNMYAEKGKAKEAERVILEIRKAGFELNKVIMHSLLKAYVNSGLLKKARNVLDEMDSYGFRATEVSYTLLLDGYTKAGCGNEAQALFDQMKEKGIHLGSYAYSILISYYSRNGKVENVKALANEINSKPSASWDLVLYNILLKSYCEWGFSEEIIEIVEKLAEGGLEPDRATLNILITHFTKEKKFELATRTLEDLKKRNLRPSLNSYVPIISGLTDIGRIDEALQLFQDMQKQSIVPSVRVFEIVVTALCKEKRSTEALKFLNEMKALKMAIPESCLENFLIVSMDQIELVKELITEDTYSLANLDKVNYSVVFHAFEEEGRHEELCDLLEYMESLNCIQIKETLNHFLAKMQESGKRDIAMKILQYFPKVGFEEA